MSTTNPIIPLSPSGITIWFACKSAFGVPFFLEPVVKTVHTETKFYCPVLNTLGLPSKFNHSNLARVSSLVVPCGPSTIFRRVISSVINSLYRVFWRPCPHVFHEIVKSVFAKPSIAHPYAPTSVVGEFDGLGPIASAFDISPRRVFGRWGSVVFTPAVAMLKSWHVLNIYKSPVGYNAEIAYERQ